VAWCGFSFSLSEKRKILKIVFVGDTFTIFFYFYIFIKVKGGFCVGPNNWKIKESLFLFSLNFFHSLFFFL